MCPTSQSKYSTHRPLYGIHASYSIPLLTNIPSIFKENISYQLCSVYTTSVFEIRYRWRLKREKTAMRNESRKLRCTQQSSPRAF